MTEIQIAKVLDKALVEQQYGIKDAEYLVAPTGKLFRGFTANFLAILSFNEDIRFFNVDADFDEVLALPAQVVKGALEGKETLISVTEKTAEFLKKGNAKEEADKAKAEVDKKDKTDKTGK